MLEGTGPKLVKQMKKKNMEKEDHNLENDAEMEDFEEQTSEDGNFDYDPDNDHCQDLSQHYSVVDFSEVLNGIKDLKGFMTQKFDA